MKILLSGSSGLIGSRLKAALGARGDIVVPLVRGKSGGNSVSWSPDTGKVDSSRLEGMDAVVHLAGESIASGRWTSTKKNLIRDSRVVGTRHLAERLSRLNSPPKVFVGASAIGIYGDRGDAPLDERASPGTGFLAEVCQEWEAACRPAAASGIRVVHMRTGIVLDRNGGALGKMRVPFSLGLGGRLGNGRQYMSWISLDDIVGAITFALVTPSLEGPVNGVGPAPVTNQEFTRALGRALRRPTPFPVPRVAARLLLGEMADALLFASQRVLPKRLQSAGYSFRHTDLTSALAAALSSR